MVISNTIKNAIRDWLQVKMNECYKAVTNDTIDMFKFETNWIYEGNLFKQYDPTTGRIIKDQFDNPIKYIPCAVQSITGERREIPNTYIADVSIPIAMLIFDLWTYLTLMTLWLCKGKMRKPLFSNLME